MAFTFENLVAAVRDSPSFWSAQFSMQQMAEGLHDALRRMEALESAVKDLQAQLKPKPPPTTAAAAPKPSAPAPKGTP